jgi:aryl-alcohol dehydrogenase-like predicted oxidoreductase
MVSLPGLFIMRLRLRPRQIRCPFRCSCIGFKAGRNVAESQETEMGEPTEMPLIFGGHSFISQLGNDPPVSEADQRRIVECCLQCGIRWFDTTYQPERVALGNMLHTLGSRNQATIMAWNFFKDFSADDQPTGPERYQPHHIDMILEQLHTDYVDCLVIIPSNDAQENRRQVQLLIEWRRKGYVRFLGLWIQDAQTIERFRNDNPFRFAIRPFNVATPEAAPIFAACKVVGWKTIATSPFRRGWELDNIVAAGVARGYGDAQSLRPMVADLMLRFALFQRDIDRVIVGMRKIEWIERNLESVSKGPLTAQEHRWLRNLRALTTKKRRWWQRVRWLC